MTYTLDDLCRLVDHTNLKADASAQDMQKLCDEARQYHFKMVAINSVQSQLCAHLLAGTDIDTGAAISFPLGQTSIATKVFEAQDAMANGANEIDYVINITELKNGNLAYMKSEMTQMVAACHANHVPCKVIFENCYLSPAEIKTMATIAKEVRPDFIKTATGFGTSGATVADVRLMKSVVGDTVKVKAAGGIRDADTFLAMVAAGADRIGCSAGIKIIEVLKQRLQTDQVDTVAIDRPYAKVVQ
ncbi:deoxyribose-phosphate aldolase [Lactiplantibacillus fabifermentans]|uniref:deoxyribose-phosphate aldolase n=1 Tax=Lactiplantibacillus fabifermentans TaxID=483011 RepID=UPI000465E3BD|nr:deoxyribose-phosphate aldolase [Lactiplantibacillus fabifermentans]